MTWLTDLGATSPVVAAPMAGGPTTPALALAAATTGSLGFLAGGYLTADALAEQVTRVCAETSLYAVNLFAPSPLPVGPAAYAAYRELIRPEAERYGVDLPEYPVEDDDHWRDKVDFLIDHPVPVVSFTFGIPEAAPLAALRRAGSLLAQTVTSAEEARQAADAGVDVLVVQASSAGGHSGTLTPDRIPADRPLVDLLREVRGVGLPLLAAGGVAARADVAALLAEGADAAAVGTLLLLADESGASPAHRAGLVDHGRDTAVMRGWTGRPARGLRNAFSDAYDAAAPLGYPAIHHLTRPIRRAAAAAVDPERVNLWAGRGFRAARRAPAAEILQNLG